MKIATLAKKLEEVINHNLDELCKKWKSTKVMIEEGVNQEEIEIQCMDMRTIAKELQPVLYIIEAQYPQLKELFVELLKPIKKTQKRNMKPGREQ